MAENHDGIHREAGFYFAREIRVREIVTPFLEYFSATFGTTSYEYNTTVDFALLKPRDFVRHKFGFDREIVLATTPYNEIQPRFFQSISKFMDADPANGRVDPLVVFLVSDAKNRDEAVATQKIDASESRVIVTFSTNQCITASSSAFIDKALEQQLYARDLYDIEDPVDDDYFFFGRGRLIYELVDSFKRGQNIGLFGLRKTGKTSTIFKLRRLFKSEDLGDFIYFNLERPTLYSLSWYELLGEIRNRLPGTKGVRHVWDEHKAIKAFERAIKEYKRSNPERRLVIALDEIEHIAPKLSLRAHWDKEYLDFWKAARAIQNQNKHFSFMIVGANASVLETPMYDGIDNPLFSWAKGKYIPAFDYDELVVMIATLGKYAGLRWSESSLRYLLDHYGGHPLLTRLACSKMVAALPSDASRPHTFDANALRESEAERDRSIFEFAQHILGMLQKWYPDEAELLKLLGRGDADRFENAAKKRPDQVRHLIAYGLITANPWKVRLPFLMKFLETDLPLNAGDSARPDAAESWASISELRNRLETKLRRLVKRTLVVKCGPERWIDHVLKALPQDRREKLVGVDRDEILQRRLFFSDLLEIVVKNWGDFSFISIGPPDVAIDKSHLSVLLNYINTHREDAHAKPVAPSELSAVEVACATIEKSLDRVLID